MLHDVVDGFAVIEYLEGEALAESNAKGLLALEQALKIAVQIDRAHLGRVVPPSNVMLSRGGRFSATERCWEECVS